MVVEEGRAMSNVSFNIRDCQEDILECSLCVALNQGFEDIFQWLHF